MQADGSQEAGANEHATGADNDLRYEVVHAYLAEAQAEGERQANNLGPVMVPRLKDLSVMSAKRASAQHQIVRWTFLYRVGYT
ncbi:hypothetical protein FOA52_007733 [Chlamydomonas sp. UWO 241]|nr:hypothetical protein FOA52_007733 [Chlamydomonas sp. UWO 241]